MASQLKQPRIAISTTVNHDLWNLAKENYISWNEALDFGIKYLIAEKQNIEFPECDLLKRMKFFQQKTEELTIELEALKKLDEIEHGKAKQAKDN